MASILFYSFLLLCAFFISQCSSTDSESLNDSDPSAPEMQLFFKLEEMKVGYRFPVYFKVRSSSKTHFLPKEKADSIPFSSKDLPRILKLFKFAENSSEASKMALTHTACERPANLREIKFCADSRESLNEKVRGVLGSHANIVVLRTKLSPEHKRSFQNYTVLEEPKKVVDTHKQLGCHILPYPYMVYFCHTQMRDHLIYKIPMVGDDGERIEAVGACHTDTALFDPDHIAFKVLKNKPGDNVCHFMQAVDYFFVST